MPVDQMPVDQMPVDQMPVDQMPVGQVAFGQKMLNRQHRIISFIQSRQQSTLFIPGPDASKTFTAVINSLL
jgi:hypothetical protein